MGRPESAGVSSAHRLMRCVANTVCSRMIVVPAWWEPMCPETLHRLCNPCPVNTVGTHPCPYMSPAYTLEPPEAYSAPTKAIRSGFD